MTTYSEIGIAPIPAPLVTTNPRLAKRWRGKLSTPVACVVTHLKLVPASMTRSIFLMAKSSQRTWAPTTARTQVSVSLYQATSTPAGVGAISSRSRSGKATFNISLETEAC